MKAMISRFALLGSALVLSGFAAGGALACSEKSDCSGGDICCFVPFGDFDVSDSETFSHQSQEIEGTCMPRKDCASAQGNNVVYEEGTDCPSGQSVMTCTLSNGASVTGCFAACP